MQNMAPIERAGQNQIASHSVDENQKNDQQDVPTKRDGERTGESSTDKEITGLPSANKTADGAHLKVEASTRDATYTGQFSKRESPASERRSDRSTGDHQANGGHHAITESERKNASPKIGPTRPPSEHSIAGHDTPRKPGGTSTGHEAYIGHAYSGHSSVNSIGTQSVAVDPGSDPGTAVHALHLPKINANENGAIPGISAYSGNSAQKLTVPKNPRSFSVIPVDLGSMSLFGTIPWGPTIESDQNDTNVGKDGMGLLGSYYVGNNFDRLVFQRPDSNINYIWTGKGPGPLMPPNQPFTVRWTGKLVSTYTEPYTIMTASDDGVRVYLNGNLIIDNWTVHAVTEDTATVDLVANQPNDITVEYFEKNGMSNEIIKLYWESKDTPLEYVPETSLLYPQTN
jgi:hypothetical protein